MEVESLKVKSGCMYMCIYSYVLYGILKRNEQPQSHSLAKRNKTFRFGCGLFEWSR